ncbi:MAG: BlaI/MecI/CopY family transcriptional regulator [Acidobacteria bacterium]|nr:BlaI/MecI/CopY family transcriptional regulator [Acidobacteriota bacterium]
MAGKAPLGEQELALLRFVAGHGPLTVAEAVERFGQPRGLARSTVLTMMERLRQKGYLTRRRQQGVYRYASPVGADELLRGVVAEFVDRALGGSLTPFVAYLTESRELTDEERAELERLVERLRGDGR